MPSFLNSISPSLWWRLGCLSGATAVGLGAFGAHSLKSRGIDPYYLKIWETGTFYHFIHALAILMLANRARSSNGVSLAATSFAVGTFLFSGSLYTMTLTEQKWLGAVTPFGGICFIIGWLFAAFLE